MGTHRMIRGGMGILVIAAVTYVTVALAGAADPPQTAPTTPQDVIGNQMPAGAPTGIDAAPGSSRHDVVPERELGKGREVPMTAPKEEGAMFLPLGLKGPDARDAEISREQDERSAMSF